MTEERAPLPLWAQLTLTFTVPLWAPFAPAVGWLRDRYGR